MNEDSHIGKKPHGNFLTEPRRIELMKKFVFFAALIIFATICFYIVCPKWIYYDRGGFLNTRYNMVTGNAYQFDSQSRTWEKVEQ